MSCDFRVREGGGIHQRCPSVAYAPLQLPWKLQNYVNSVKSKTDQTCFKQVPQVHQ